MPPRGFRRASAGANEVWDYSFDANRNITAIAKPGGTEAYGYDGLNRLDDYTLPGAAPMVYGYDAVGNRTSETQSGVTVNQSYGITSNRLTAKAAAGPLDTLGVSKGRRRKVNAVGIIDTRHDGDCAMSAAKKEVQALLDRLPDDCSLEDVQYHLYVIEKVQHGIAVADEQGSVSQAQAEQRLAKWTSA